VKICGCTSIADVEGAVDAGADAVGLILAESSKRVTLADVRAIVRAVPAYVSVLAVFVRPSPADVAAALALGCVAQFSGDESAEFCSATAGSRFVKALHFDAGRAYAPADVEAMAGEFPTADIMFDSRAGEKFGGTGTVGPWDLIAPVARRRRVIVSGGLTPENVGTCVRQLRPFGVDVRTGVETRGIKDDDKVRAFVRAVRESDAQA
jgi:phosphoribosylanthranilate isomerase